MLQFKDYVDKNCKSCKHIRYCRGGCPYNAMVPASGDIKGVDPHCVAYKKIFDEISDRFNKEMMASLGMEKDFSGSSERANKPGIMALMRKLASN
jgi:uncharacterized protein